MLNIKVYVCNEDNTGIPILKYRTAIRFFNAGRSDKQILTFLIILSRYFLHIINDSLQ